MDHAALAPGRAERGTSVHKVGLRDLVVPGSFHPPHPGVVYLHPLPFLPNAFGDVMRPGTYYVIAGLLVVATVPMYAYMFRHAGRSSVAVQPVRPAVHSTRPVRLMPGERCYSGFVFQLTAASAVQLFDAAGQPVACVVTVGRAPAAGG